MHFLSPITFADLTSDHNPVLVNLMRTNISDRNKYAYDYKKCNWRRFKEIINTELKINNHISTNTDIDVQIQGLTNIYIARDRSTRLIKFKPKVDIIPLEILNLIKFKNTIKKRWQILHRPNYRLRLNQLQKTIRQKLKDH